MEHILEKARELGKLIADSEVFTTMTTLEEQASSDSEISELYANYTDLRDQFSALQLEDEDENQDQLVALATQLRKMEADLNSRDKMAALSDARNQFDRLMNQVNRALQSQIMGEDWAEDEDDMEGYGPQGCAGCSGCGPER